MTAFADYIGTPWEEGAQGPNAFDCMSFVARVQREHFGIDIPEFIIPDYSDQMALVELMRGHEERQNWGKVDKPLHGDLVLIHRPMHYGVWLSEAGGGVLHCVRGQGVVFTRDAVWRLSGFGRREYFRHRSKH